MMNNLFENYKIKNVTVSFFNGYLEIYISFFDNPLRYVLKFKKTKNGWKLFGSIEHSLLTLTLISLKVGEKNRCEICCSSKTTCSYLDENKQSFFEFLIDHPTARLRLLKYNLYL